MEAVPAWPVRPSNTPSRKRTIWPSLRSRRKLAAMLAVGDQIPDVCLWVSPQEQVSLREAAAEKPLLLLFYLFDWSST
jgi:hypothetical protein